MKPEAFSSLLILPYSITDPDASLVSVLKCLGKKLGFTLARKSQKESEYGPAMPSLGGDMCVVSTVFLLRVSDFLSSSGTASLGRLKDYTSPVLII